MFQNQKVRSKFTKEELVMKQTTFKDKTVTDTDIRRAMDLFDKQSRQTFNRWRIYAIEHDGKQYPPKEILSTATGIDVSEFYGGGNTNSRLKELGFNVIKIGDIPPEDEIEDAMDTSLSLERDLEKFLISNLSQLEPGLRLYHGERAGGQQVDTKNVGRLDILAIDQNDNLVVIELKAGEADDRVCGQILRYMGWVQTELAGKRKVRGIIVANDFTDGMKLASKTIPHVALRKYEVNFRFTNIHTGND